MPRKRMTKAVTPKSGSGTGNPNPRAADKFVDVETLRHQASDIIESILGETEPEGSEIRERLRLCLSLNAGNPERALLQHLMSLRSRSQAARKIASKIR
ncbi:hypothetical protein [Arthrobacter sp.]|uniref:hypothetical protein n=1 Tax=Arthrobacter sp. TaxID=1667 RepID=UPI0028119B17|nr:hypothetical protein [Arthrobacter sp.]